MSRTTTRRTPVLLLALALVGGACTGGSGPDGGGDGAGWTVLSYSMADTDLEPFMLEDVDEMGEVGSGDGVDIVALVDRASDYTDQDVLDLGDWHGAKLVEVGEGEGTVVEDMGDVNTGDPAVLQEFVATAIADHPAEHYALVISDHGASWPGVGADESAGHDVLDLPEIRDAVAAGLEDAGVDKLDLLGFDACLMATYEVASTMAPLADRMIASQELEPGHGWDYRALSLLEDDPSADVDTLGKAIIDGYQGQAEEQETSSGITLSMVDLTKMGAVDDALSAFGKALTDRAATVAPVVGRERAKALGFGRSPDPTEDTHMTDLGQLAAAIGVEALDVADLADTLVKALNDAVVERVDGAATKGATGLSIYFPPDADYFQPEYGEVEQAKGWASFLAGYYGAGRDIPASRRPTFTNADDVAETFFDEDGFNIIGTFDPASGENLVEAIVSYGIVEADGSVTYLGEEPGAVADDGSNRAIGIYDLTALSISDGEDTAFAYITLDVPEDEEDEVFTVDVPMAYYEPGDEEGETYQDVLLSLTIDGESGDVVEETYYAYDEESETYGELTADPEGTIVPEVLNVLPDGTEEWLPTSDVGLFANLEDLRYEFAPLDAGTEIQVELTVYDFGGNADTVVARTRVQ